MTKIKICGLTREEDIAYVNELLPDYVGFVFAKSKRKVTLEKAKGLIDLLDRRIKTVGVFVNEDVKKVRSTAEYLKLDILQFHGSEDEQYIKKFSDFSLWKSLSIEAQKKNLLLENQNSYQQKLNTMGKYDIDGILLDSSTIGTAGGTGVNFDWSIVKKIKACKPLILAGGLNAENIQKAIEIAEPYMVDVSSGVEEYGVKNFNKINEFIKRVREF